MGAVMRYTMQNNKTECDGQQLVTGINCQPESVYADFMTTKRLHHKTDGVLFYHMVQSFPKGEVVDPGTAHAAALKLAEYYEGYEVLVCTHTDREHIHSHFLINSVNFDTGKKLHVAKEQLQELRQRNDQVCMEFSLPVFQPKDRKHKTKTMTVGEYHTAVRGQSKKLQLMNIINDCMRHASSREEFIALMESEGYKVRWETSRRNITYTTPSGWQCRDRLLFGEKYLRTAACAKHFAVHSGPEEKRHYFDAKVSMKELWETYLPQFEACVREGKVEAVMGAYNRTNGEPCCAHSYLMVEVLRKQWGFQGHYVSDCWAIRDFHEHHKVTDRPEESVRLALEMGCDVNCGCTYQKILNAYEEGLISKELLQKSAIRLFTTRFLLGMFDETEYDNIPYEVVECREHIELSIEAACKSVVLLKNDGILPLNKKKLKTIGVIGPNANSREALIGNYHGTASRYVTVLEGIQDYVGDDVRVLYSEGCHLFLDQVEKLAREDDRISEAMTVAEHSDLVILCLGLDESLEGEEGDTGNAYASGDKQGLMLPPSQQRLLEIVAEMGVPFIVCMMAGSAMDLNLADNRANAVLQTWYPGARGGKAVADILFGEISPSGKLPVTIYRNLQGMPDFDDYSMKNRTYRFVEKAPLYPFGYGLNYADTLVTRAELTEDVVYAQTEEQSVGVEVTVANHGDVFTEDVLQVYVQVEDINEVPNPKLAVFKRVELAPGEEKMVTLEIPRRAFTVVDEEGKFVHTGRGADIYVGFGQPDERTKELTGKKCLKIHI